MSDETRTLIAKSQIHDVMARYVRGVDHLDADVLKSCYHPDGYEHHHIFNGNAHEFADWRVRQTFRSHHMLSECAITIEGERALVETPHTAVVQVAVDKDGQRGTIEVSTQGWYLDLFTERDGVWKIAYQRVVSFSTSTRFIPAAPALPGQSSDDGTCFSAGFGLGNDRPAPSHVDDVASIIRDAFFRNT